MPISKPVIDIPGNAATATTAAACSGNAATATAVAFSGITGKPTTVSGYGITDTMGNGQTWQAMIGSRAAATTYTNTSGKPIAVCVWATATTLNGNLDATINGLANAVRGNQVHAANAIATLTFVVPAGATYSVTATAATIGQWQEMR